MEYYNDGYETPNRGHSPPPSRQSSPVSAVEYEFFIEHETNRNIVQRCIEDEQTDLTKESTASKALYKANLMKVQRDINKLAPKVAQLKVQRQRNSDFVEEAETMLFDMKVHRGVEEEMLQCKILNLRLLKEQFMKDKEWRDQIVPNDAIFQSAAAFSDNLFADKAEMTKREAIMLKHRLEHIKYLYVGSQTSNRRAKDEKAKEQAAKMKAEAMEKFNRLNGIQTIN